MALERDPTAALPRETTSSGRLKHGSINLTHNMALRILTSLSLLSLIDNFHYLSSITYYV